MLLSYGAQHGRRATRRVGVACWICRHGPFGQEGRAAIGPDIADEPDQDVEGVTALESQTTRQATTAAVDTLRSVRLGCGNPEGC
jgi:hypothetical protein